MAPDYHDTRVVDNTNTNANTNAKTKTNVKRKSNNNNAELFAEEQPPSSSMSSLSVVNGNQPVATMGIDFQAANSNSDSTSNSKSSPLSSDATRAATTTAKTANRNEAEQRLDFIGTTNAVKKLFSMSLDVQQQQHQQQQNTDRKAKKPTLLAVHNFDGTLIIDDAEDESNYEFFRSNNNKSNDDGGECNYCDYNDDYNNSTNTSQSTTTLLPSLNQSLTLALSPQILADNRIEQQLQRDQQLSKDTMSMLSNIVAQSTAVTITSTSDHHHQQQQQQQQSSSAALLAPPKAPREYVQWKFQDLNMLLGHDGLVVRPTATTPTSSSSSTANDANSEASVGGGGIAVRVEDVRFLRSVWETFQRQQMQQQQQQIHVQQQQYQHQAFLKSTSTTTRSYAQALLQERESESENAIENENESAVSGSKELTNTTSVEVAAAINVNDPQKKNVEVASAVTVSNPNGTEIKSPKSGFTDVPLQTCIVPFPGPLGGKLSSPLEYLSCPPSPNSTGGDSSGSSRSSVHPTTAVESSPLSSPALSIVLDAYLDNLMANVPQLALCLEEKGLIQSVKMLPTEEIPSMMLHPSTLDTSRPLDVLPSRGSRSTGGNPADGSNNNNHRHHRRRSRSGSVSGSKLEETMFSPQIMEMNASALLRFLKTNCTRNHATYLLRHEGLDEAAAAAAGGDGASPPVLQNIQLYDISSISTQKQKKWIWWLATMSYRFALRLRHLETSSEASSSSFPPGSSGTILSESQKRAIRDRQRSLFQQTLDLLQDLMDIDGNAHESMVASVREHMADTYLSSVATSGDADLAETTFSAESSEFNSKTTRRRKLSISELSPSPSPPVVTATISATASVGSPPSSSSFVPTKNSAHQLPNSENAPTIPLSDGSTGNPGRRHRQPYAALSVDALNKAQDHLIQGIKILSTLFERDIEERRLHRETKQLEEEAASKRSRRRPRKKSGFPENEKGSTKHSSKDHQEGNDDDERIPRLSPAMVLQLFGMNFKLVNISLRLVEHHLGNYYSSSAMQALRTAARRLNDAARLLDYCSSNTVTSKKENKEDKNEKRNESLQLQYIWLLEHCGHFARSFASDELWRDRGHASGEDVISVLSDVENVFVDSRKPIGGNYNEDGEEEEETESQFSKMVRMDVLLKKSRGRISLQFLSGVVAPFQMNADRGEKAIEAAKKVLGKEKVLRRERRRVLVASCVSYSRAITAFQFTVKTSDSTDQAPEKLVLLNLLRQRLGDACNETGKVLLAALRILLVNNQGSKKKKDDASQLAAEALLDSAEFWFTQGLDAFEACNDTRNLALLRCNLCQSFKLRANSGFSKRDDSSPSSSSNHAEDCLQMAADQLMQAHVDLGQKDVDPHTWDMVSEELAATFLVLGVRRRQSLLGNGNTPVIFQVMRLSPGEERSIVDPMERALKIYEQSDNAHQGAAVHYQLALTFSKLWTCQLNESNTRKKLSKAFGHYSSAFDYFSTHSRGNEPTFCLLCLDLASLYAAIPGEEGLMKSLGCCLDCCDTFSVEAMQVSSSNKGTVKSKADWYDKMETIAQSVDDRVFKLLRSLVKVDPVRYKDMYREGLTAKMVHNVPDEHEEVDRNPKSSALLALHEVLLAIKKLYGVIVCKS